MIIRAFPAEGRKSLARKGLQCEDFLDQHVDDRTNKGGLVPKMPEHTVTQEELADIGERLSKYGAALSSYASQMHTLKIESIEVTHESQKDNAVRFAKNFTTAVHKVMFELTNPANE